MDYEIGADESVGLAVVRAVSAVEGCDPCSLRSLEEVVDLDALDAIFDSRADGTPRSGGRLSFIYSNCRIAIENGEYLTIALLEDCPRITPDQEFALQTEP